MATTPSNLVERKSKAKMGKLTRALDVKGYLNLQFRFWISIVCVLLTNALICSSMAHCKNLKTAAVIEKKCSASLSVEKYYWSEPEEQGKEE
jgi:hypothetical protein